MSIPTQAEYERAEQLRYCAQAQRCDAQPLADARSAQADYAERLRDPEWFARSVRLVLLGDYGWWIGKRAGEVAQNRRMNRCAWLAHQVALLDCDCPQLRAMAAWRALSPADQTKLTAAIGAEIDSYLDRQKKGREGGRAKWHRIYVFGWKGTE